MRRKILTYSNKVVIKEKSISKYFSKSESFQNEYLANQYVAPLGISPRMIGFDDVSLKVEYEKINGIELSKMKSFISEKKFIKEIVKIFSSLYTISTPDNVGYLFENNLNKFDDYVEKKFYKRLRTITIFDDIQKSNIIEYFEKNKSILKELSDSKRVFLHYDLKPSNIFVVNDGIRIIDFDKSSIGSPYMDLSKFYWRTLNFNEPAIKEIFKELDIYLDFEIINFFTILHMLGSLSFYNTLHGEIKKQFHRYAKESYKFITMTIR
ncbi:MAG: phosphotransferase [Streptococcus salivarius]|nr:phosphotransferase [Streptococcus salivarius]MDU2002272.1 phosphotransferase [Streptococcus salivarius]MDU2073549.1 phosphotransferase [Streptococcus salivarius]